MAEYGLVLTGPGMSLHEFVPPKVVAHCNVKPLPSQETVQVLPERATRLRSLAGG